MNITTERLDDFPLLLEIMVRLGLPGIMDNYLQRHGLQQGLSWGWIATIWLAHILTQSNPCKQPVQVWTRQAQQTQASLPLHGSDQTCDRRCPQRAR